MNKTLHLLLAAHLQRDDPSSLRKQDQWNGAIFCKCQAGADRYHRLLNRRFQSYNPRVLSPFCNRIKKRENGNTANSFSEKAPRRRSNKIYTAAPIATVKSTYTNNPSLDDKPMHNPSHSALNRQITIPPAAAKNARQRI